MGDTEEGKLHIWSSHQTVGEGGEFGVLFLNSLKGTCEQNNGYFYTAAQSLITFNNISIEWIMKFSYTWMTPDSLQYSV